MQIQGQPEQAVGALNEPADDDWNDADAELSGVMANNDQDDQLAYDNGDEFYNEPVGLEPWQSDWIPPHRRPFSGYGQA